MAIHIVTDPEGREHEITGPDDATPEQVMQAAQHLIGKQGAPRGGSVLSEPGQPEPGRFGPRAIEPGSTEETVNEWGKTIIPLLAGAGAGGLLGKGASAAMGGAAPRLLPAAGRVLGTGAVGGAQTPGDLSDKAWGGAKAVGSAAAVEAALPLLLGGSRMIGALRNLTTKGGPGVTNVHIKSAPPTPAPTLVQTPGQIAQAQNVAGARQAVGAPAQAPPPGIPDPHDPSLNIVDVIRSRYGLSGAGKASVPAAVQTGTDALAGTDTGQNVVGIGGLGLLGQILSRLGLGGGASRPPTFQHSGELGAMR